MRLIDCCLKQEKITCNHGKVIRLYTVYELELWPCSQANNFAIKSCLFGAFQLTENADPHNYYWI